MASSNTTFSANELFDIKHLLKCVSFLRDLTSQQLDDLVNSVECISYDAGSLIIEENKKTTPALYIIRTGYVWLKRQGEDPVKLMQGCHFGEDMLDLASGEDDNVALLAPYNITVENRNPFQKAELARLTLEACRKVFEIDQVEKIDKMYIRRKSRHPNPFADSSEDFGSSKSIVSKSIAVTVVDEGDTEDARKAKHKKKKKKHDSSKKKKKKKSRKSKYDSEESSVETSRSGEACLATHAAATQPAIICDNNVDELELEPELIPAPAPVPVLTELSPSKCSFADIRRQLQERTKDQPNPFEFIATRSPVKSPPKTRFPLRVKGSINGNQLSALHLDLSAPSQATAASPPSPRPAPTTGDQPANVSPPKTRSSSRDRGEKKKNASSTKNKGTADNKSKGERIHSDEEAKQKAKKKPVDKHLHKARQDFDERSKKTRKEAKSDSANNDDKPIRPPANVFQYPLPLHLEYQAPQHPKTQDDEKTITRALSRAFPFKNMVQSNIKQLIAAFEPTRVDAGIEFVKPGSKDDYFYVVNHGKVTEEVEGKAIREVGEGEALGNLNLVHSTKNRVMSVRAKTNADLFRVDQTTYRKIVQTETTKEDRAKQKLLEKIGLLQNVSDRNKRKLCGVMEALDFKNGETIVSKVDYAKDFYIIKEGSVRCQDPDHSSDTGRIVGEGAVFGETALVTGDVYPVDVTATSDVTVYRVTRKLFEEVLGPVRHVIVSPIEARTLCSLEILRFDPREDLNKEESNKLVAEIEDQTFAKGQTILHAGDETPGALFFVRQGRVEIQKRVPQLVVPGGVFGDDLFAEAKRSRHHTGTPKFSVVATEKCVCGVLKISGYRDVFEQYATPKAKAATWQAEKKAVQLARQHSLDMQYVPKANNVEPESSDNDEEESHDGQRHIPFHNLVKMVCLGEGNFGQVWMVHDKSEEPQKPYALKIQSKFQLVREKQAQACIREKEAMAKLRHPNIIRLAASYQDEAFVYMLLPMIQGGELFNLMHPVDGDEPDKALPEPQARFYAFVIADALAYLHEMRYVYRDLKPENVLLDWDGYPVLVDFGFAKRLTEKT
jgi:CRP-like cAMP-binding protein